MLLKSLGRMGDLVSSCQTLCSQLTIQKRGVGPDPSILFLTADDGGLSDAQRQLTPVNYLFRNAGITITLLTPLAYVAGIGSIKYLVILTLIYLSASPTLLPRC